MKAKTIITALAIGLSIGVVSQAGAWMGDGPGHRNVDGPMMGQMMHHNGMGMMGGTNNVSMTPEQQSQVQDIKGAYQNELQDKEAAIQAKIVALDNAYADESTTVGEVNVLRQDLYNLKQDYWQTRRTINNEISQKIGSTYYGVGGWGPEYCAMDYNSMGSNRGQMMVGQNSGCGCRM